MISPYGICSPHAETCEVAGCVCNHKQQQGMSLHFLYFFNLFQRFRRIPQEHFPY